MAIVFDKPAVVDPNNIAGIGSALGTALGQGYAQQTQANKEQAVLDPILDQVAFGDDPRERATLLMKVLSSPALSQQSKANFISAVHALPTPEKESKVVNWWDENGAPHTEVIKTSEYNKRAVEIEKAGGTFDKPGRSILYDQTTGKPVWRGPETKMQQMLEGHETWTDEPPEKGKQYLIRNDEDPKRVQQITLKSGEEIPEGWTEVSAGKKDEKAPGTKTFQIGGQEVPHQWDAKAGVWKPIKGMGGPKWNPKGDDEDKKVKRSDLQAVYSYEKKAFADPDSYELSEEEQKKYEENPKKYKVPKGMQLKQEVLDHANELRGAARMSLREEKEIPYKETSHSTLLGIKIPGSETTKDISGYEYPEAGKETGAKKKEVADGDVGKQLEGKKAGHYRVNGKEIKWDGSKVIAGAGTEGKEKPMDKMPDAAKNKDRIIRDTSTGKKYKSDGTQWKEEPAKSNIKKDANHDQAVSYLKGAKTRDEAIKKLKELKKQGWTREQLEGIVQDSGAESLEE